MNVYASYWDDDIRIKSSSGGLFSVIATSVIEKKGIVYGVSMTKDCYGAEFARIFRKEDLIKINGSKYLQAKLGNTFISVKDDLEKGNKVLFSGTVCQVNGLKKFLGKEYENLLCIDVICHGVPSPKLWKQYILYRESKIGKIQEVNFRCKENGWHGFGIKENDIFTDKDINPYMQMFLRDVSLRPSCYKCTAKDDKKSDITLADFWGIETIRPSLDDDKGISLVIVRTENGENHFDCIKDKLLYEKVTYEEGVKCNPSEFSSVLKPKERDFFYNDLQKLSFDDMIVKYASPKKKRMLTKNVQRVKSLIKRLIKC